MNEVLVKKWNTIVKKDDTVYLLGDFAFPSYKYSMRFKDIIALLNGNIIFICGNHDKPSQLKGHFKELIKDNMVINIDGQLVLLSHFPYTEGLIRPFDNKFIKVAPIDNGLPLICSHVHIAWHKKSNMFNCGVDMNNYMPVSLEEVVDYFKTQGFFLPKVIV